MDDQPLHILMVDDDEDDYLIVRDLLRDVNPLGYALTGVSTYEAALDEVTAGHDVWLIDFRLGEESGLDLLRVVRGCGCRAPMIMLTGRGDHEIDLQAMAAGAADYLDKSQLTAPLLERSIRYAVSRVEASEALRQSEERFRALVQNASDITLVIDKGGIVRYASPALQFVTGYRPEEVVDRDVSAWVEVHDAARLQRQLRNSLTGRGPLGRVELRYRHADGTWRYLEIVGNMLLGDSAAGEVVVNARDVSERKRAELALREAETRYRTLVEMAPDPIYSLSTEALITALNPAFQAMTGWAPAKWLGKPFPSLVHPDDLATFGCFFERLCAGKTTEIAKFRIRTRDRGWVVGEFHARPRCEGEHVVEIIGIVRDVGERERAITVLTGQERVFELLATGAPLTTVLDALARVIEEQSAGALCALLVIDDDGTHLHHAAAPSLPPAFVQAIERVEIGPAAGSCGTAIWRREPVVTADIATDPLWADLRNVALEHGLKACWSTPLVAGDGRVLGALALYHREANEVSDGERRSAEFGAHVARIAIERVQAEATLRNTNQLLRAVIDASPLAVLTVDPAATIQSWNPAAERLTGRRAVEVVGRKLPLRRHEDAPLRRLFEGVLAGETLTEVELPRVGRAGATMTLSVSAAPLRGPGNEVTGVVGLFTDISERKRMADILAQSLQALEATVRQQEVFIFSVSHDLRTPLITLQAMADILLTDFASDFVGESRLYLERLAANVERMRTLLDELREYLRIGRIAVEFKEVDLNRIAAEVVADLADTLGVRGAVVRIDGELPTIWANPVRMSEVLQNLIENAVKYTPPALTPVIVLSAKARDDGWEILVRDNGVGIPPLFVRKVFEVFQRLPAGKTLNPGGSGLGLTIVARIIEVHGGRTWVESQEGVGTTVHFTLPKHAAVRPPEIEPAAVQEMAVKPGKDREG